MAAHRQPVETLQMLDAQYRKDSTANLAARPSPEFPGTQRVGAFTELPALMRQFGVDPAALLARAGLPPGALDAAEGRIPYAAMGRLLALAAEGSGCRHIGLIVGKMWRLADLGVLGEIVRNSPTLGDALRTLVVHQHLNSGGGLAFLLERGGVVDLGYAIYHPRVEGAGAIFDAVLAGAQNYLRELAGPGFVATEVMLPHGRPQDVAPYRACFRLAPRFDAEIAAVRFPASMLSTPIAGADPARYHEASRRAAAAGRGDLLQQLQRAVRVLMLSGEVSGEAAAQMLELHRRTLNRRLKAQGTTFQAVLDGVRAGVASQLLEGTNTSLDDVASTLCYASVSPFMRAFRRWTGVTPGQWRRDAAKRVTSGA